MSVAAQTPDRQRPIFRSGIEVVQLDAVVLDKDRRPVTGLTASDFTVLENGRPRPIVGVFEMHVSETTGRPGTALWLRDAPHDVATNVLPEGRLLVLVLDDATIPADPGIVDAAKEIARGVIDRMGPADLAAVVFTLRNDKAQDFTNDRRLLRAAVDTFSVGFALMGGGYKVSGSDWLLYYQPSVRTLYDTVELLQTAPGRRKAVIYVSTGVPLRRIQPTLASGVEGEIREQSAVGGTADLASRVFERALRGNVSVYPVDPGGLAGLEHYFLRRVWAAPAAVPDRLLLQSVYEEARVYLDFLKVIADNTGGRAVLNTNEFNTGLDQIFVETAHYYLVGYEPAKPAADGRFRRLEVRVTHPDITVVARKGYYAVPTSPRRDPATAASPLDVAVARTLPRSDIPMALSAVPFPLPGARMSRVALALNVEFSRTGQTAGSLRDDTVAVQTRAFTVEGHPKAVKQYTGRLPPRSRSDSPARYELLSSLDLPPGRYELRVSAHRESTKELGSVYATIDIPDFARRPVSLSGLVFTSAAGGAPAMPDDLAGVVPVLPTTRREFAAGDAVTVFFRVYRGERVPPPVKLTTRVVNERDEEVFLDEETLDAARFTGSPASLDRRFALPLAVVGPGQYLITVSASTEGNATEQNARFAVR